MAERVRGACPHDCPDTCALVTTVEGGRAVHLRGDPDHANTAGFLCVKVNHYLDRTYSPDRVLTPLRRVGAKGEGRFAPIGWDEALDLVAGRLAAIAARNPEAILPYSYSGTLGLIQNGSMDHRFFHRLGASRLLRTICAEAGTVALERSIGWRVGPEPRDFAAARLIVLWGTNTLTSNVHLWPHVEAARAAGAHLVVVDPLRTKTAERADEHLPIRPGTDAALVMGMLHVIFAEGLEDRAYLEAHTEGHEALRRRVAEWPVARAAAVTGLEAEAIAGFARRYATTRPAAIRLNYGLQRHRGGGAAVRAIVTLPAVTGAWRDVGGGALLSTSGAYPVDRARLERPDLMPAKTPRAINMIELGRALDPSITNDPAVEALFVYAANPAVTTPDQEHVLAGLRREDLFVVVHELFLTDTARYADVVLPATTQLEQLDIHKSYGHLDVLLNRPAIAPLGEAVPNTELFRRLAARMGFTEPCFQDSDEQLVHQAFRWDDPRMEGITPAALAASGPMRLRLPEPFRPFASGGFFGRPDGKMRLLDPSLAALGVDPLVGYEPPLHARSAERPFVLLSPPVQVVLNSSFANLPYARRREPRPELWMHPGDAAGLGLAEGAQVEIASDRGSFRAELVVTDRTRPGVVSAPSLFWLADTPTGRNANAATSATLADLGGGATFYDVRVSVRAVGSVDRPTPRASSPGDGA